MMGEFIKNSETRELYRKYAVNGVVNSEWLRECGTAVTSHQEVKVSIQCDFKMYFPTGQNTFRLSFIQGISDKDEYGDLIAECKVTYKVNSPAPFKYINDSEDWFYKTFRKEIIQDLNENEMIAEWLKKYSLTIVSRTHHAYKDKSLPWAGTRIYL